MAEPEGLSFPCDYPVKAMVRTEQGAHEAVINTMARQAIFSKEDDVSVRLSRNGSYKSITITVRVHSRDHLEAIYQDLRELDSVVMTL
mgnify:FL=1